MKKTVKKESKIHIPKRQAKDQKSLKTAIEALPDSKTHAWFKVIGGNNTNHKPTGLKLKEGTFAFLSIAIAGKAELLFKRVSNKNSTNVEEK